MHCNRAVIHLDRLISNIEQIKKVIGENTFFCPMVKADAYGHGSVQVAKVCEKLSIPRVGVMFVEEALTLRQAGIGNEIIVHGRPLASELKESIAAQLTFVIHSLDQIDEILQLKPSTPISIHVKFNTGMNRLGCNLADASVMAEKIKSGKMLRLCGIMTHLSEGENISELQTQSEKLQSILSYFPGVPVHVLNTPGLLASHSAGQDPALGWGARIGGGLYGLTSGLGNIVLRPVMTLKSQVIHIQSLAKGERVSYNGSWRAPRKSRIAVVPIGYADGYPRSLSNIAEVAIEMATARVVGNVCMDFLMIDVTDIEKASLGSEVTLWGDSPDVNSMARLMQTTPYEITSALGPRVRKEFEGMNHD